MSRDYEAFLRIKPYIAEMIPAPVAAAGGGSGVTMAAVNAAIGSHAANASAHHAAWTMTDTDARYYTKAQLDSGQLDGRYFTESESDSRFVRLATAGTITARHTFNPGSAASPFVLGANAQGQLVGGLNADQVDGYHATYLAKLAEANTFTASQIYASGYGGYPGGNGTQLDTFEAYGNNYTQLTSRGPNYGNIFQFQPTGTPTGVATDFAFAANGTGNKAQLDIIGHASSQAWIFASGKYGAAAAWDIVFRASSNSWDLASERVRIVASTGNVGIGTASPGAYKLAVAGDTWITGNAVVSGYLSAAADTDTINILGRTKIYSGVADNAQIAHFDHANNSDYGLRLTAAADTMVNAANGRAIYHRINNADTMVMNVDRLNPAGSILKDLGDYNRKWRTLFAAELYVETLVAQDVISTIGGRIMVTPTSSLIADINSSQTTIDLKHNSFTTGEYLYLASAPGGIAQVEVMNVNGPPTTITGGYRYSVTRNVDGSGANSWVAGDAVAGLGNAVGKGYIDLTATSTLHNHLGPTMTVYHRSSIAAWNSVKPVVSVGNLRSFVDYSSDHYGIAHGNDLTLTPTGGFSGMTSDNTNGLRLFNTALSMYISGAKSAEITVNGGLNFYVLGNNTVDSARSVGFIDTSANEIGKLGAYYYSASGVHGLYLSSAGVNGRKNQSYFAASALNTTTGTGKQALVRVSAESYGGTDQGLMAGLWLSANKITTAESYIDLGFSQSVPGTANTDGVINLRAGSVTLSSSILNSNDGVRLGAGAGWTNYPNSGNGSEISNDIDTYKALILSGNKADGGSRRRLMLFDHAHIGSNVLGNTVYPGLTGGNTSAIFSLAVNVYGRSSALMANAFKSDDTAHLYTADQATYYGGQAAGTAPLMMHMDPNAVEFKWFYGPTNLAPNTTISSWSRFARMTTTFFEANGFKSSAENKLWKLSGYTATAPSATGYVSINIDGVNYKLLAST